MKVRMASILIVLAMSLSACQQSTQVADTTTDTGPEMVDTSNESSTSGLGDQSGVASNSMAETTPPPVIVEQPLTDAELRQTTTLFFDFDRSDLRSDHQAVLAAHARYLNENPNMRMRLEGHADERGSREYNVGLGQRRAQAVKRNLTLQGVQNSQLNTISYGEEKPLDPSHNEYTYQSNRRVELVYN